MNSWLSIKWFRLVLLLLLSGIVGWFLGYQEFGDFLPTIIEYISLVVIPGMVYLLLEWIRMRFRKQGMYAESVSIFLSLLIGAVITFFLLRVDELYAIAYFAGYFVLASFLSLLYYVANLFRELEWKMAQPKKNKELDESLSSMAETVPFELLNPKGRTVLSIPFDRLICFEANDNYINIYFESENGVQKRMERLSMKKVELMIEPSADQFLRVHKSYMINRKRVKAIHGKAQSYQLQLDLLDFEVPVSRRMSIYDYFSNI
jgi:hypothetical protein